jgi:hypothetical protein
MESPEKVGRIVDHERKLGLMIVRREVILFI